MQSAPAAATILNLIFKMLPPSPPGGEDPAARERGPRPTRVLIAHTCGELESVRSSLEEVPDQQYEVSCVPTAEAAVLRLASDAADVVLLDLDVAAEAPLEAVRRVVGAAGVVPVVVVTDWEDAERDLACIRAGAQDALRRAELGAVALRRSLGFALSRGRAARAAEMSGLRERYGEMSSASVATRVTSALAGLGPVRERAPAAFAAAGIEYARLLVEYAAAGPRARPVALMQPIADTLGALGGGPRDLVDLHLDTLDRLTAGVGEARARPLVLEGRLLALEMMGLLVDYYRLGRTREPRPGGRE